MSLLSSFGSWLHGALLMPFLHNKRLGPICLLAFALLLPPPALASVTYHYVGPPDYSGGRVTGYITFSRGTSHGDDYITFDGSSIVSYYFSYPAYDAISLSSDNSTYQNLHFLTNRYGVIDWDFSVVGYSRCLPESPECWGTSIDTFHTYAHSYYDGWDAGESVLRERGYPYFDSYYLRNNYPGLGTWTIKRDYEVSLVDPAPTLLKNGAILTTEEELRQGGRTVGGVAADGVATILVRIKASAVDNCFKLSVANSSNTDEGGALGHLGETPSQRDVTVCAKHTSSGPIAIALYRAPLDFAWNEGQHAMRRRDIDLRIEPSGGATPIYMKIGVVRPPVVLVHGLWGAKSDWESFTPLIRSELFSIKPFDYELTHAFSIAANANMLADYLGGSHLSLSSSLDSIGILKNYESQEGVASKQADFVVHSMGGLIVRSLPQATRSAENFKRGYVHKLISIGTPYLGSPLARELVKPENGCIAGAMGIVGNDVRSGALQDLAGDGTGSGLSAALRKLTSEPMAMLAGRLSDGQINGFGGSFRTLTSMYCNTRVPPLTNMLTKDNYDKLMSDSHDGIVPLTSALNNGTAGFIWGDGVSEGAMHSQGSAFFGLTGPSLLDGNTELSNRVLELLNTPVTSKVYVRP